ncbi:hypothetical protein D3C71_1649360 [compost metagenome]
MVAASRKHSVNARVGSAGMPGSSSRPPRAMATRKSVLGKELTCRSASRLRLVSEDDRVTMMPVPTAITSAGTWVTMPSPIVKRV